MDLPGPFHELPAMKRKAANLPAHHRLDQAVDLACLLHLHHVTRTFDDLDLRPRCRFRMLDRNDLVLRSPDDERRHPG